MKFFLVFMLLLMQIFPEPAFPNNSRNHPFRIKKAYYQSWIKNEDEKGTNIILELDRIKQGITFDSIIFRGIQMEIFIIPVKNRVILKSILPTGRSRLKIDFKRAGNLPDQLIYHQDDQRKSMSLKLTRRNTIYFKAP